MKTLPDLPSVFEELPGGCLLLDDSDVVIRANETLRNWLGYAPGELIGKRFVDLLPMSGKLFYANHHSIREGLAGEARELSYELRAADKSLIPVFVSTRTMASGQRVYLIFRAEVRRQYESKLLEAKKDAEEANRARATFLNTITHEVRTPIHAVLGVADLLRDTELNGDQQQLLRLLTDSGHALLGLVNDVLDLSRAESNKLELRNTSVRLEALLQSIVGSLRATLTSDDVELTAHFGIGCPTWVSIDAGKLRQILTNLLGNAIKFTKRGSVRLEVDCEGPVSIGDERIALNIAVVDSGVGIPADQLDSVFKPFIQATSNDGGGGTGLGLAISQRIAQALGGEIVVESELGKGTTFRFQLLVRPSQPSDAPAVEKLTVGSPGSTMQGRRVLVVDDNATNLFIARRHLKALGITSTEASSGEEAIAIASRETFDLVMLDLRMPGMDGYETAAHLRELALHQTTPILAVTAASFPKARSNAEEARFAGRLLKPYNVHQLRELLAKHLPSARAAVEELETATPEGAQLYGGALRVDFAAVEAEFGDDAEDLRDFLDIVVRDLRGERAGLQVATRTGDTATVRARKHKLGSIIKLLNPQPLERMLVRAGDADFEGDRLALARVLTSALDETAETIEGYRAKALAS